MPVVTFAVYLNISLLMQLTTQAEMTEWTNQYVKNNLAYFTQKNDLLDPFL